MESVKNIRGNWKGLRKGERGFPYPIPPIHFCWDSHSSFWAWKSFFGTSIWVKWGSGWEPRFKFYVEGFPPEAWLIQGRRKTLPMVQRTQALSTFTCLRALPQSTTFVQSSVSSNFSFTQSCQYLGGNMTFRTGCALPYRWPNHLQSSTWFAKHTLSMT